MTDFCRNDGCEYFHCKGGLCLIVSGDDVDKTMQFASVKIGGSLGEPFHKNQKLKWDHKVLHCEYLARKLYCLIISVMSFNCLHFISRGGFFGSSYPMKT